jgi:beta-ureidopropionase
MSGEFESLEASLKANLPPGDYAEIRRILYGKDSNELSFPAAEKIAEMESFEFKAFSMTENAVGEQGRRPNIVRIGLIQNKIHKSTSAPINEQFLAIYARIEKMIEAAAEANVNVLCLQEII